MQLIEIPSSHNIILQYQLASLSHRIFAWIIDFLIMSFSVNILMAFVSWNTVIMYMVLIPSYFFYNFLFEMFWNGQTLGKKIMGIRVISTDGEQMSLKSLLLRWSFRFIDIGLSLGIIASLSIFSSRKNQRVGDLLANTIVINSKYNSFFSLTSFNKLEKSDHEVLYPEVVEHFTDEEMLKIKSVLQRLVNKPNSEVRKAVNELYNMIVKQMAVEPHTKNKKIFLQYIIKDYIILSR